MWKRDEAVRPTGEAGGADGQGQPGATGKTDAAAQRPAGDVRRSLERDVVNIGKSVVIKGELNGSEDLTIEGQVEGKIELRQHGLTIGPNGKIKAQVFAKSVIVLGEVTGNITATERINIRDNGSVDGDLAAPRVAIADGAHFLGSIDMERTPGAPRATEAKAEKRPAQPAAPAAPPPR